MTDVFLNSHSPRSSVEHMRRGSRSSPPPAIALANCHRSIFAGVPLERRTNVWTAVDTSGESIVLRDSYYHWLGRHVMDKQNTMKHIPDDGFGVPRLGVRKSITTRVSQHHTPSLKDGTERSLSRFLATGSCLLRARTVNELLMAVYDILEVHRTWLYGGNAVHSIPWCGMEDVPLTIGSLLARNPGDFRSLCLIIDHDDASAQLGCDVNKPREPELPVQRTGTPMYVARSVCMREVLTDSVYRFIPPMPEISGEARALYVGAYGKERYERYNNNQETYQGARPPNPYQKLETAPPFRHRPEHDVESIYWTMVTALLRVRPENIDEHPEAAKLIVDFWTPLLLHRIPDTDSDYADPREGLLLRSDKAWRALFLGDMKDVGTLLGDISHQIRPEYAFCGDGPQRDHLHEAVQRLILQYLVEHEDIHLDPEHLRIAKTSTVARLFTPVFESSRAEAAGALGTFQNSSQTLVNFETCGATERKSVDSERVSDATQSAECTNSSPSGTRVAARVPCAIVVELKRRSFGQSRRRPKRQRDEYGAPQSIEEDVEESEGSD